jgi:hypothetical protein
LYEAIGAGTAGHEHFCGIAYLVIKIYLKILIFYCAET